MKLMEHIRQEVFETHAIEEYRIYFRKVSYWHGKKMVYRIPVGMWSGQDVLNRIPQWGGPVRA